jgi:hypothetical protein
MRRLALTVALSLSGCIPTPVPTGPTCADACANGRRLAAAGVAGCEWSTGVPSSGASCEVVCENASAHGNAWQLDCLSRTNECGPMVCP